MTEMAVMKQTGTSSKQSKTQTSAVMRQKPQDYSLEDMQLMAKAMAQSRMLPGWDSPEKIFTLMLLSRDEGSNVTTCVLRYDNIGGRISKRASAMLEDFIKYGGKVRWVETSDKRAAAVFIDPNGFEHPEIEYTFNEASKAGLVNKDNWKKYTADMLRSRLIARAMRMVCPQATGLYVATEEAMDGIDTPTQAAPSVAPTKLFETPKAEPTPVKVEVAMKTAEVVHEPEVVESEPLPEPNPQPAAEATPATPAEQIAMIFKACDPAKLKAFLLSLKWIGAKDDPLTATLSKSRIDMILAKPEQFVAKVAATKV